MKTKLLLILSFLFTLSITAQHIVEPLSLSSKEIKKEQWILQDEAKNLTLEWTASALEITLANKAINQDQQKTVYARIPIKQVIESADEYIIHTDQTELLPTFTQVQWSLDDQEFFRVLENSVITLGGHADEISIKKGTETKYTLYSTSLDRFYKFITRFDWGLIALNRKSDNLPKMVVTFDFTNQIMVGTIDNIPFAAAFTVYFDQDSFCFHNIEFNTKYKGAKKAKDKYAKYFTSKAYHYDIAEQTLNFYSGDDLVLMYGMMHKQQ